MQNDKEEGKIILAYPRQETRVVADVYLMDIAALSSQHIMLNYTS